MNSQALVTKIIDKGDPVTHGGYCNATGRPIVVPFDGENFLGVCMTEVVPDSEQPTRYDQARINGFVAVLMTGAVVSLEIDADIGDYIEPIIGGWNTTKKRNENSVGRVIYRNKKEPISRIKLL